MATHDPEAESNRAKLTEGYRVRILTRYILGEILSHTVIGCALFTFILFMRDLPHILEMMVRNSSTFTNVLEIFLLTLPNTFRVTIPMAVLVGILLGLSRLAADSEVIAMRASGLGVGYFVKVASIVAGAGTVLGLINSIYVTPRANQAILEMQQSLATSQASYEIQPRVFYEDFRNRVLYVQDVRGGTGAANWREVFMANVADPTTPLITTAASATVVNDSPQELLMRLRDGAEHQTVYGRPEQYNISTFSTTDLPLTLNPQSNIRLGRLDTSIYAMPMAELKQRGRGKDANRFLIEWHSRFAYPAACIVLMLVGVPLGVTSRRGGKSSGLVFTLLLVLLYYVLSYTGIALSKQDRLSPFLGVWLANISFAGVGIVLLWEMANGGRVLNAIAAWALSISTKESVALETDKRHLGFLRRFRIVKSRQKGQSAFPRILDAYVIREFLSIFSLVLSTFVLLMLVFTFFELVGDILRNHIRLGTVGAYLINLTPSMLYQIAPLAVLIGVLVTFGVLNRNSEIIAMKATGISIYRLVVPIVSIATILAACLYLFDQFYLPQANRRQEALRNTIKGRPPQTFLHPEQTWIFGETHVGQPSQIFYYQFFDRDRNEFANLSVFEVDPATFSLTRRIFAARAFWNADTSTWVFQNGWKRDFHGAEVIEGSYQEFKERTFAEIMEQPSYFTKESLQSQEMNFAQLRHYIQDLRQSGFDTMRLRVALWHKIAYPLVTVIMSILAIPFALSMGKRGSLTGVAVAILLALAYWVVDGLFGAMGSVNDMPAIVAAWAPDVLFALTGGYLLLRTST